MKTRSKVVEYTQELKKLSESFSSGNEFLDDFIKSEDSLNKGLGKTYVWLNEEGTSIIGYYNIGVGYIDMFTGDDKYKIGGSIHLNFFAVNIPYRGVVVDYALDGSKIRFSDLLFADFITRVNEIRDNYVGFSFITLAATDEGYSLYKRNYFEDLDADLHFSFKDDEKGCRPMYLALDM